MTPESLTPRWAPGTTPVHLPPASSEQEDPLQPYGERELAGSLIRDRGAPVVEIGPGTCASLTLVLAAHGFRTLTIDQDAVAVTEARHVLGGAGVLGRVAVVQAEAARLPLRSRSVRTVVAYDALHHATDLRASVAGIARVLHRRGRLIVSDWDEAANGFLGRLTRALRVYFRKVVVTPRDVRRMYVCEHPRRVTRRAGPWSRGKPSAKR